MERLLTSKLNKALRNYHLIDNGDNILVALSGGKDSLCLIDLLAKRQRVFIPHFSLPFQGIPDGIAGFGIQGFHLLEDLLDVCSIGIFLVWTELALLLVALLVGVCLDVCLMAKA